MALRNTTWSYVPGCPEKDLDAFVGEFVAEVEPMFTAVVTSDTSDYFGQDQFFNVFVLVSSRGVKYAFEEDLLEFEMVNVDKGNIMYRHKDSPGYAPWLQYPGSSIDDFIRIMWQPRAKETLLKKMRGRVEVGTSVTIILLQVQSGQPDAQKAFNGQIAEMKQTIDPMFLSCIKAHCLSMADYYMADAVPCSYWSFNGGKREELVGRMKDFEETSDPMVVLRLMSWLMSWGRCPEMGITCEDSRYCLVTFGGAIRTKRKRDSEMDEIDDMDMDI